MLLSCLDLGSKVTQASGSLWRQTPCANRLGVEGSTEIEGKMLRMTVLFTLVRKKYLKIRVQTKKTVENVLRVQAKVIVRYAWRWQKGHTEQQTIISHIELRSC